MLRLLADIALVVTVMLFVMLRVTGIEAYFVVGAIATGVALIVIYATQGLVKNRDNAPLLYWLALTVGIAVAVGLMWSATPLLWILNEQRYRAWHKSKGYTLTPEPKKPCDCGRLRKRSPRSTRR